MTTPWDHLLHLVIFFLFPLYAAWSYRPWVERVKVDGEPARLAGYRETLLWWIGFAAAALVLWALESRPLADLGLGMPQGVGFGLACTLAVVLLLFFVMQLRIVRRGNLDLESLRESLAGLEVLIPRSRRERRWFFAVSINAGITEELLFRGYLFWYLGLHVETWQAAGLTVLLFTYAHAYQGWSRVPGQLLMSTIFVALAWLSGSIWICIVFHAALDILQGQLLHEALKHREREEVGTALKP